MDTSYKSSPIEHKTAVTLNNISNDYMVVITTDSEKQKWAQGPLI